MTTLDALITHWENTWQKPATEWINDLPHFIIYAIRVYVSPVWSGADILCEIFAPHPKALMWAQACYSTTRAWNQAFTIIESDCIKTADDVITVCQCILQRLGSIIADSAVLFEQAPSIQLQEELEAEVFNVVKQGLSRLAEISVALEQRDMTWLKEIN